MRLTKRQLKRIIREEYSRLKRKGLIREYGGRLNQNRINDMIMYLDDLMMTERGEELEYGGRDAIMAELQAAFPDASREEINEAMMSF